MEPDERWLDRLRSRADGGDAEAAVDLGDALEDIGRVAEAEDAYRQALALGRGEARGRLARILAMQGRYGEAEPLFREVLAHGDIDAARGLGALLTHRGRPEDREEAEALHQQALAAGDDGVLLNYATLLAYWPGREEEAEQMFQRALEAGITDAYNNLGMMLRDQGREEEAEEAFRGGIEAGDSWAWYGLGLLLSDDEDRLDEAVQAFTTALDEGYDPGSVHRELGDLYDRLGRPEEAEREYLAAIEAGEEEAHLDLGILYQYLGRYGEAEDQYRTAIDAGIASAHTSYGNLLDDALHRPAEAEEQYQLAIAAGADEGNATYNLALCIERQGRSEEAVALYRKSADLGFTPAHWVLHWRPRQNEPGYKDRYVWIGHVGLKPLPGTDPFDGGVGAFTSVLGLARDRDEFHRLIPEAFGDMPVTIEEIEDVGPFERRTIGFSPDHELFQLALKISPESPVLHWEFFVYMSEDE